MGPGIVVIYHANCLDGFCAAWVIRRGTWGREVEFIAAKYGDKPPNVKGKYVIIVDFSYPAATLEKMIKDADTLWVFDHHKTAQKDLSALAKTNNKIIFDMDRSGATLARAAPLIEHTALPQRWITEAVEDGDLWRFKLPDSEEICLALSALPRNFGAWNNFEIRGRAIAVENGRTIKAFRDQQIEAALANFYHERVCDLDGVPTVNAQHFQSEIGHALLKEHPGAPFVAIWYQKSDQVFWSLRSEDKRRDVSELAKKLGGGGHRNAAGFTTKA